MLNLRATRTQDELDAYVRKVIVDTSEILQYCTSMHLDLVDAAFAYQAVVGEDSTELVVNALYKQVRNNHLHLFLFGPYTQVFDIQNDPVNLLYKNTFLQHIQNHADVKRFSLHWFYTSPREDLSHQILTYSAGLNGEIDYISGLYKLINTGAGFPLVPCRYTNCQFRTRCFPED